MHIKELIKNILPYSFVINRRNRRSDFSTLVALTNVPEIEIEEPNYQYIVSVQGFGYSGSGAVLDLLREYEDTQVLGYIDPEASQNTNTNGLAEIEIIRLPGGLYEIENNLDVDNVFLNAALFNRTVKLFESSALYSYNEEIKRLFCSFFKSITSLRMHGLNKTYYNGYLCNPDEKSDIYFKKDMTKECYLRLCNNFLTAIFNRINNGSKYLIADQLFSDTDLDICRNSRYVKNLKSIVVVRDPRDIYAWAKMRNIEWIAHNNVGDFIAWYKMQYKNVPMLKNNNNCLVLDYENVISDYENTVIKVEQYLGYFPSMHSKRKQFFDPSFSKKFVGIYKSSNYFDDYELIKEHLSSFCNPLID